MESLTIENNKKEKISYLILCLLVPKSKYIFTRDPLWQKDKDSVLVELSEPNPKICGLRIRYWTENLKIVSLQALQLSGFLNLYLYWQIN